MARIDPGFLQRQLKHGMRPDARRWLRPDFERHLPHNRDGDLLRELYGFKAASNQSHAPTNSHRDVATADAAQAHRRWQIAVLRRDWELLRFALLGRKAGHPANYNPAQPRVPAGNADGGQWTSEGAQGTPTRVAGPCARGPSSSFPGETPRQRAEFEALRSQADQAVRAVRRLDPNWREPASLSEPQTIQGAIRAQRDILQAAEARLDTMVRLGIDTSPPRPGAEWRRSEDMLAPGGQAIGTVNRGAEENIRTVSAGEFQNVRTLLMDGARPVETPKNYRGLYFERPDGLRFGLRLSEASGQTIDIFRSGHPSFPNDMKVHQK